MQITPSAKSSFLAGVGLSLVAWTTLFHFDELAELFRIQRWMSKDRLFDWISKHKTLALMFTEMLNYGFHGVSNPLTTVFAMGSTVVNAIFIFLLVPIDRKFNRTKAQSVEIPVNRVV